VDVVNWCAFVSSCMEQLQAALIVSLAVSHQ
jgi:hypothetical protein